jgi:hydroxyacylglutathione hydrolase
LGARTIEVIQTPGHTKGSICLLDRKEKYLFTGDNDNILVWLHPPDAMPLEVYLQSLKKVQAKLKDFNTILPGHGDPVDGGFVNEQVTCCESIVSGKCTGQSYQSFVGPGMVCSYKRAQIVFDPKKIHNK